jgi:hypothetical protein
MMLSGVIPADVIIAADTSLNAKCSDLNFEMPKRRIRITAENIAMGDNMKGLNLTQQRRQAVGLLRFNFDDPENSGTFPISRSVND